MFSEIKLMPNVNGGPKNCIEWSETSVKTRTCCRVSTAVTISDPEPKRRSPAVLVGNDCHVVGLSWSLNRINNGSCVPIAFSGSQPNAIMCRSLSETSTCLAIVGVVESAPAKSESATARPTGLTYLTLLSQ